MPPKTIRERFDPPWRAEEMPGGFRVVSANGRVLAYIYARDDLVRFGRDLSTAEALAIAKAIAGLPEVIGPGGRG